MILIGSFISVFCLKEASSFVKRTNFVQHVSVLLLFFGSMERILERYERYSYAEHQVLASETESTVRH